MCTVCIAYVIFERIRKKLKKHVTEQKVAAAFPFYISFLLKTRTMININFGAKILTCILGCSRKTKMFQNDNF